MPSKPPPFFILTGPPGSGKTTLTEALADEIGTIPEAARRVLLEERATGGQATGEQDPAAFVQRMLDLMISDYECANGQTVFDRGMPDLLAFCSHYDLPDQSVRAAIDAHRYQPRVFILPSWSEIYQSDSERRLDFDGARAFGALTREAYRQSGYALIDVPKTSVAARRRFVLTEMAR